MRRRKAPLAVCAALAIALGSAGIARAAFPQDPPNDPSYAPAEQGGLDTCLQESADDQEHHHFSFMPQCTPLATDAENAAGMSTDAAWRDFTAGNGQTVIAYVEAGINWHNGDAQELANRVFLNSGELPAPTTPVNDGTLNARDYADTSDVNGNAIVDPEDIIARFSDNQDDDSNGYTDDISGWDFYDNQNDPATVDSEYGHANGQMKQAAAEADNGSGGVGICPRCMLMPIKGGAEALDRTDDLAEAWLYATDMNADVIVSVTADLGYSTFMKQAVEYAWDHDVVMVEASNDFNSIDHQGGMFHSHVLPGNGLVSNAHGIPGPPANAATVTYRARSGLTSWGTHNVFSGATEGGSTSESTPTVGGAMALTIAYGKEAAQQDLIDGALTNDEAIQVVRDTASDIASNPNPPLGWNGKPGWDMQYGYGRPNLHKALQAIHDDEIPPVAWFDSPDWYKVFDPTRTSIVPVTGHVDAPRTPGAFDWKLEFAPGAEPTDAQFNTASSGSSSTPINGPLGSINLSQVPQSFWEQAFSLSDNKELETNDQYTVTLRLRITDAQGRVGEERRAIAVRHDASVRSGFPKQIGIGSPAGEAQPVLADLQGTGKLAMVFGDADGVIHALGPSGNELPGWPVKTDPTQVTKSHPSIDPGNEPIVFGAAVGDLDHTGELSVVATSTTGRTYVWNANGQRRSGWPKTLNAGVSAPAIPRPAMPFTRLPVRGATASPVLVDMDGDEKLEIAQSGWDGHVHVWKRDGSDLAGWPVEATLPPGFDPPADHVLINDHKVDLPPAVAELDDDPEPELLVRSQFSFAPESTPLGGPGSIELGGHSNIFAFNEDGSLVSGYPVSSEALIFYYGSAQEFITEGINDPAVADLDGDGKDEWSFSPGIFSPTYLHGPDGSRDKTYGPVPDATLGLLSGGLNPATLLGVLSGDLPTDAPVSFTTWGAFGKVGPTQTLSFAEPGSGGASTVGALVLAGSGIPIKNYIRVHDANSGANIPGFPSETQGLDFLGAPAIADVTGDGAPEVLEGGDSSALHAFTTGGAQAPGFPKFHSGWVVFSPAVGDLDSDGKSEVVAATREGYLYVWDTDGTQAGNQEWWNYRHDERNTANYGLDTRPPGILRDAQVAGGGSQITFKAAGDDWYAGTADHYEAVSSGTPITPSNFDSKPALDGEPAPGEAGASETYEIPTTAKRFVAIRAVDEAGNVGPIATVDHGVVPDQCDGGVLGDDDPQSLEGTNGPDRIRGLGGDDELIGHRGADCLAGDEGDDTVRGGRGGDALFGGLGADLIRAGRGRDAVTGGGGDDEIFTVSNRRDTVSCGAGDDRVHAGRNDKVASDCEHVTRGS